MADRPDIHEEHLFEVVAKELQQGTMREGLWAKALSESIGNQQLARALYIRFRVDTLREEERAAEEDEAKRRAKAKEEAHDFDKERMFRAFNLRTKPHGKRRPD